VLVTTERHLPFSYLPGGRVEMGEDTRAAVARELREELGRAAEVGRLLFVVENFHPWDDGQGTYHHEIGLYYAVSFPDSPDLYAAEGVLDGRDADLDLIFLWKRPADVSALPLFPAFLRETLSRPLPEHPVHILNREAPRPGA
jgi:ADP-ribose pyrophosphatase YjhB (NUDIX family)